MFPGKSAVNLYLWLDAGEHRLQSVVRVRYDPVLIVIECPQAFHVPSYAEICASEPRSHIGRSLHPLSCTLSLRTPLYLNVPFVESPDETLHVHSGHTVGKWEEFTGGLDVRIAGQIMPYSYHLVKLAVLDLNVLSASARPHRPSTTTPYILKPCSLNQLTPSGTPLSSWPNSVSFSKLFQYLFILDVLRDDLCPPYST